MIKQIESSVEREPFRLTSRSNQQSVFIGSAFVFLNLFIMSCVGVYWTNTAVHQYVSGRPL